MKIKPGVSLEGIKSQMLRACAIVDEIYIRISGHEVTLTSALDGKHKADSFHYLGLACDYRTRDVSQAEKVLILARLKEELLAPYEVYDEGDHFHIEFDEKG